MKQAYRFAIFYFALFSILLLAGAVALQGLKIGFSPESIRLYYQGDASAYMAPKSVQGQLKSAMPHLASMGLFIMVAAHFLLFAHRRCKRRAAGIATALFAAAAVNVVAPFFILSGATWAVYLKLAAFWLIMGLGLWLLWLLCLSSWRGIVENRV